MTVHASIWKGTHVETIDLLAAISRYCACEYTASGVRVTGCPSHHLLLDGQAALDRLLFARRIADRLRAEEHDPARSPLREETV